MRLIPVAELPPSYAGKYRQKRDIQQTIRSFIVSGSKYAKIDYQLKKGENPESLYRTIFSYLYRNNLFTKVEVHKRGWEVYLENVGRRKNV